jgi:hypothetical protein
MHNGWMWLFIGLGWLLIGAVVWCVITEEPDDF